MCCNVRDITSTSKQKEVKKMFGTRSLGLVCLLETKVKTNKMGKMYQNLFSGWCFCSNSQFNSGGRVIVAWNAFSFQVNICYMTAHLIHCHVCSISSKKEFWCTFVYAYNTATHREDLWSDLEGLAEGVSKP